MKKYSTLPYMGLQTPPSPQQAAFQQNLPAVNPSAQPQAATQQPGVVSSPSPSSQVSGGRQSRGYGNTPIKQTSNQPGSPGRPPIGSKKMGSSDKSIPVNGPLSGLGATGIGMSLPAMSPIGSDLGKMAGVYCNKTKKMKKSIKKAGPLDSIMGTLADGHIGSYVRGAFGTNAMPRDVIAPFTRNNSNSSNNTQVQSPSNQPQQQNTTNNPMTPGQSGTFFNEQVSRPALRNPLNPLRPIQRR